MKNEKSSGLRPKPRLGGLQRPPNPSCWRATRRASRTMSMLRMLSIFFGPPNSKNLATALITIFVWNFKVNLCSRNLLKYSSLKCQNQKTSSINIVECDSIFTLSLSQIVSESKTTLCIHISKISKWVQHSPPFFAYFTVKN